MRQRGTALLLKAARSPRNRRWLGEQGIAAQWEQLSAGSRLTATQAWLDWQDDRNRTQQTIAATDSCTPQLNQSSNPTTHLLQSRDAPDQPLQATDTPLLHGARHSGVYVAALGFTASAPTEGSAWGPVSAAVDAIDALHAVTGLPWWATFAGTALGENPTQHAVRSPAL